ncbi:hypothetical protein Cmtc_18860 [Cupriavidus sp. TKC]|uniref:hypothetical protein n=1 Tax=Cupriavidus sp. TKC TaxID=2880159 RepID=UPI0025A83596|nr:hypothetical protein [Cupriavidus sp. TKC]GMG90666.1 hypothetical protein Cmtc_18860 [Cupriavidus sp. TKC]
MGFMKVDRLKEVLQSISGLVDKQVLVGIPDSAPERQDDEPISNAAIGYIQETGSPANNLPARPFLVPGVAAAEPKTLPKLQQAVEAALDGDLSRADKRMAGAGLEAQNSVRARINSGISPELKESTLANRRRRGRTGTVPLIDTGQLRNSITYVIRKRK